MSASNDNDQLSLTIVPPQSATSEQGAAMSDLIDEPWPLDSECHGRRCRVGATPVEVPATSSSAEWCVTGTPMLTLTFARTRVAPPLRRAGVHNRAPSVDGCRLASVENLSATGRGG
jgi:hypothetical protein